MPLTVDAIPTEISSIIPKFDGDERLLNLYIKKCEYVINCYKKEDNPAQDLYVFHVVSSKLIGKAAHLISERPDIESWAVLKSVLTQHFGDPRSEECIAIQLETLKINHNESYLDFCNRIQQVKSTLIAKVNLLFDDNVRRSKVTIYDNMAMNVFLFNLPEDLIRIVRLKSCRSLEQALSIVLEEVNFQFQYNSRNKMMRTGLTPKAQPSSASNPYVEKFGLKPFYTTNANPQNQGGFRFGVPNQSRPNPLYNSNFGNQTQQFKFGVPHSNGFRPQQPQQNFKFGIPYNQNLRLGSQQAPQGYRPPFGQAPPRQAFNQPPSNQFKFGIPQANQNKPSGYLDTDVSMRTALPARPNQAHHNEIQVYSTDNNDYDYDYGNELTYNSDNIYWDEQGNTQEPTEIYDETMNQGQDFYDPASDMKPPS